MNATKATLLATVEEHGIGGEDRVFFAHQDQDRFGNPLTAGTKSGWYWQCRGYGEAYGPFMTRDEAEKDYDSAGE